MSAGKWNDHIAISRDNNDIEIKISELIPSGMMALPKGTSITRLTIRSLAVSLADMKATTEVTVFNIGYAETFGPTTFLHSITALPGSIILTGIAVECLDDHMMQVLNGEKGVMPRHGSGWRNGRNSEC